MDRKSSLTKLLLTARTQKDKRDFEEELWERNSEYAFECAVESGVQQLELEWDKSVGAFHLYRRPGDRRGRGKWFPRKRFLDGVEFQCK